MASKPTEERIQEVLRKQQQATCMELASKLGMTKANIQYHLQKMAQQKSVESRDLKLAEGKGRPVKIYRLQGQACENNYKSLCEIVLAELMHNRHLPEPEEGVMTRIGERLAKKMMVSGQMIQRLNQLIHTLNRLGYQANWEARQRGPMITFRNCPYAAMLGAFPSLCLMDEQMIKSVLSAWVVKVEKSGTSIEKKPTMCRVTVEIIIKND